MRRIELQRINAMTRFGKRALVAAIVAVGGASAIAASDPPKTPATGTHAMGAAANSDMANANSDDSGMKMQMQGGSAPADARDPHAYSGGLTRQSGPYAASVGPGLRLEDQDVFGSVLFDTLEVVRSGGKSSGAYDVLARFGRDYDKLVIKAEGEFSAGKLEDARTEVLWSHAVATFWDSQLGLRQDSGAGPDRTWLAFGMQGLAPYWFEIDAAAYIGDNGRTALRLSAEYELLITQRLIVQPRIEANFYGKSDPERDIGSGLSNITSGVRVRYEFSRQFAPYVGVEWVNRFGATADMARAAGERKSNTRYVAGVRFWF